MIVAITGPRARQATVSELTWLAAALRKRSATTVRHGDHPGKLQGPPPRNGEPDTRPKAPSIDRSVTAWLSRRGVAVVEAWPADWRKFGNSAGPIRNRAMLDGRWPDDLIGIPAAVLYCFAHGGRGTADCVAAAAERSIPIVDVPWSAEPRPWNMHHGPAPGRCHYVGRSAQHGGPSSLANPIPVERDSPPAALAANLADYRRWLWDRLRPGSAQYDPAVVKAIGEIGPDDYVGCTCWPGRCHAEIVISAWRWITEAR